MVAGRQVFHHPGLQGRHCILDKLNAFHREHDTGMAEHLRSLQAAIEQLPPREYAVEAQPLHEGFQRIDEGHRRGPQVLGPFADLCQQVADAVNRAPAGHVLNRSEEPVRDFLADFRLRVCQTGVQLRIDAAEAAFSPDRPADRPTPGE